MMSGIAVGSFTKTVIGLLPSGLSILLIVWDKWSLSFPQIHQMTKRPKVHGLWAVTITPDEKSVIPEGGNRGPIPGFIVINQSYWTLHIRQFTAESKSESRNFFWEHRSGAEVEQLTFYFQNDPQRAHLARSPQSLGACTLLTTRLVPTEIRGGYFTDRCTAGEMDLRFVDRTTGYASFDDVKKHVDAIQSQPTA